MNLGFIFIYSNHEINKQKQMNESQIENALNKANKKLMNSLDYDDKEEAINLFKKLYEEEMAKAQFKLLKQKKVHNNREQKEEVQQKNIKEIESNLRDRMQIHLKKRQSFQLKKIQNYKRMQVQWKDKIRAIADQIKEKEKSDIMKSNRLSQQALKFWEKKGEKDKMNNSKAIQRYITHDHINNRSEQTDFMTEVKMDQMNYKERRKGQNQNNNFPTIQASQRMKTEADVSRSVQISRRKTESIQEHLLKSNQIWKLNEDKKFQLVMEKLQRIEKSRKKAKEKLFKQSKNRSLRSQNYHKKVEEISLTSEQINQINILFFHSQKQQKLSKSRLEKQQRQSRVERKRVQIQDIQLRDRHDHYAQELRKQKRGGFAKMIKDAVNQLKLQALRSKF